MKIFLMMKLVMKVGKLEVRFQYCAARGLVLSADGSAEVLGPFRLVGLGSVEPEMSPEMHGRLHSWSGEGQHCSLTMNGFRRAGIRCLLVCGEAACVEVYVVRYLQHEADVSRRK